jgi:Zn-finger nucleic acid-binding protein
MCPACRGARLEPREIEPGLTGSGCPACTGLFIPFESYLAWQSTQPTAPSTASSPATSSSTDSSNAKLCPSCGRFMTRFRLTLDIPFYIDRCGGCAGMWFDRGEWESLRSRGLHSRLHTLFNETHQHQLRHQEAARQHEDRLRLLLGDASFMRARDFKQWLASHPQRAILLAYLDDRQVQ